LDQRARGDRPGTVRLPTRARQRCLDLRREHCQQDGDSRPSKRNGAQVVRGPAAEPTDRPDNPLLRCNGDDYGRF